MLTIFAGEQYPDRQYEELRKAYSNVLSEGWISDSRKGAGGESAEVGNSGVADKVEDVEKGVSEDYRRVDWE